MATATRTTRSAAKKVSARQAIIGVIKKSRRPMTAKEIVDRVLSTDGVVLGGPTPRNRASPDLRDPEARRDHSCQSWSLPEDHVRHL